LNTPQSSNQYKQFGLFVFGSIVCALILGTLVSSFFAAQPDGEAVTTLKRIESNGLELPVDGGTLFGNVLHFQRIQVSTDANQLTRVNCTLDFEGQFVSNQSAETTNVSSLGLEQVDFAEGKTDRVSALPKLTAIVGALDDRRRNINSNRSNEFKNMTAVHLKSQHWYIRSERDRVDVTEDAFVSGQTLEKPIAERITKQLTLIWRDGGITFENE
jgi:hypothetical protein